MSAKAKRPRGTRLPVRDRILVAAGNLFHQQGIRGVGVEAIAEAAGTNKMTLYRYFASKDELITEWVRGILKHKEEEWQDLAAKHRGDPRGQLTDWSERVSAKLAAMETRGSTLVNALAELPDPDHPARRVIQEYKVREYRRLLRLFQKAGFQDADLTANEMFLMLEGAASSVQCIGMKCIGEQVAHLVTRIMANGRQPVRRKHRKG